MNLAQQEKIRGLVQTTPLFDNTERAEWLQLLELMNDKQLFELEKILVQGTVVKKQVQPPAQSLHLSHIINLPQKKPEEQLPVKPVLAKASGSDMLQQFAAPKISPPQESVGLSKFKSKLARLFKEKELTTSKPEFPLELPEHASVPAPSRPIVAPKQEAVAPKQEIVFNGPVILQMNAEEKKPVSPAVAPKKLPAIPAPLRPTVAQPPVKLVIPPVVPIKPAAPKPMSSAASPKPSVSSQLARILSQSSTPSEKPLPASRISMVKPGLANTKILLDAKLAKQETRSESVVPKQELVSPKTMTKPLQNFSTGAPVSLQSVEDFAHLSVSSLKQQDFQEMLKVLRKLIGEHGYHEIVFSLEQSPLYSAYIDTGLKLLKDEVSFENLGQGEGPLGKRYLTKAEFERFADILRQIQVG